MSKVKKRLKQKRRAQQELNRKANLKAFLAKEAAIAKKGGK